MKPWHALMLAAGVVAWPLAAPAAAPVASSDPDAARLVTEDIPRFWAVVDGAAPEALAERLQRDYIDRGSAGLKGFVEHRIVSGEALARKFGERRQQYEAVRAATLAMRDQERAIRAPFYALKYLYPKAVFPDVYFIVGRFNSGGTIEPAGLLIGAEMNPDAARLPAIIAHELIHYQQVPLTDETRTLLAQSICEGGADFVGERIAGRHINDAAHAYGRAHERELWEEFRAHADDRDLGDWFYRDPPGERPADLGYFVGYRIAEAYFDRAADKRKALAEIITVRDAKQLLRRSGYAGGAAVTR